MFQAIFELCRCCLLCTECFEQPRRPILSYSDELTVPQTDDAQIFTMMRD